MTLPVLIAAWDDNRLIGNKGKLPWHISEDLKLFKWRTSGHPIIMGRKTWESLGCKPLPGRQNIVVSRNWQEFSANKPPYPDVHYLDSLEKAIDRGNDLYNSERIVYLIGGGQLYKEALDKKLVDSMIISHVYGSHEGDTYFPDFDESEWNVCEESSDYKLFTIIRYRKKYHESCESFSGELGRSCEPDRSDD